jgi:glycosyltransferase involved in cell wall biosynthesis
MNNKITPLSTSSLLPWETDDLIIEFSKTRLPGISIVMPVFNAGNFIEKTIRSLLCNDLTDCEIFLMDGGSSDETMDIVDHYKNIFTKIYSGKDSGQSDAINKGFLLAKKPILYWINGDDIILPNVLNIVREKFNSNKNLNVLVGNAYMTEKDFSVINHFIYDNSKLKFDHLIDYAKNHLIQPSVFFSNNAWNKCGPLREDLHYAMDAFLFIDMARNYNFESIDLDIAYSVYHEECKTRNKRIESITELAYVQASLGGINNARSTLELLPPIFKEQRVEPIHECESCNIMREKIFAIEAEVEANIELALNASIELAGH